MYCFLDTFQICAQSIDNENFITLFFNFVHCHKSTCEWARGKSFLFSPFLSPFEKYYLVDAYKNLLKIKTNEFIFPGQWESCSIWSPKNYSNKGQSSTRFNCFATEDTSEEGTSLGYPGSGPAQGLCRVSFTTENRQHRRPTQDGSYEAVLTLYTDHALFLRRDSLLYVLESL